MSKPYCLLNISSTLTLIKSLKLTLIKVAITTNTTQIH